MAINGIRFRLTHRPLTDQRSLLPLHDLRHCLARFFHHMLFKYGPQCSTSTTLGLEEECCYHLRRNFDLQLCRDILHSCLVSPVIEPIEAEIPLVVKHESCAFIVMNTTVLVCSSAVSGLSLHYYWSENDGINRRSI